MESVLGWRETDSITHSVIRLTVLILILVGTPAFPFASCLLSQRNVIPRYNNDDASTKRLRRTCRLVSVHCIRLLSVFPSLGQVSRTFPLDHQPLALHMVHGPGKSRT